MFEPKVPLKRLEKSVVAYEQVPTQTGGIVFYGSSGFTRWGSPISSYGHRPLEEDIPGCINRGFGSSTAEELLYYYPRLILPLKPRALVVSIVHNDRGMGYTPDEVVTNLAKLFAYARTDFPGIRLYACDCRPTLKFVTEDRLSYMQEFNRILKEYCDIHEDTTFVDHIHHPIWFDDPKDAGDYKKVRRDIFVEDDVHFNQLGYDLYARFMKEVLQDIL
jgi:lysophospholipase L1-like esterase